MDYDALIAASGLPRTEARALLEHVSGRPRTWLIAHGDEQPDPDTIARFAPLAEARTAGAPLAYLVGWREFHGHRFSVGPAVLIPRPETEMLVDAAIARAPAGGSLIDLGTGSGCIAISLVCERDDLRLLATDRSEAALACARRNAARLVPFALEEGASAPARLRFASGDWWQAVPPSLRADWIVSNPPYVADGDAHLDRGDLRHEPRAALAGGPDGLRDIERIIQGAPTHLAEGGHLLIEHGFDQARAVSERMHEGGFRAIATLKDGAGLDRVTMGRAAH